MASSSSSSPSDRTPTSSAPPLPLPDNWEARTDEATGDCYFIDHEKQITTWTDPRGVSNTDGGNTGSRRVDPPPEYHSVVSQPPALKPRTSQTNPPGKTESPQSKSGPSSNPQSKSGPSSSPSKSGVKPLPFGPGYKRKEFKYVHVKPKLEVGQGGSEYFNEHFSG